MRARVEKVDVLGWNKSDVDKEMLHRDAIENLWRYVKMSVTPKLHILFVHLLIISVTGTSIW